jgi:hypothetical protein
LVVAPIFWHSPGEGELVEVVVFFRGGMIEDRGGKFQLKTSTGDG